MTEALLIALLILQVVVSIILMRRAKYHVVNIITVVALIGWAIVYSL